MRVARAGLAGDWVGAFSEAVEAHNAARDGSTKKDFEPASADLRDSYERAVCPGLDAGRWPLQLCNPRHNLALQLVQVSQRGHRMPRLSLATERPDVARRRAVEVQPS